MQCNRESKTRSQKAMLAFERYQKKKSVQVQHNRSGFIAIRKYIRPLLRFLLFGQRKIYGFQVEVLKHINFAKNQPSGIKTEKICCKCFQQEEMRNGYY